MKKQHRVFEPYLDLNGEVDYRPGIEILGVRNAVVSSNTLTLPRYVDFIMPNLMAQIFADTQVTE